MKELSQDPTFKKLKEYFDYHIENNLLPRTLDDAHKYYGDVKLSVSINLSTAIAQIEKHGKNVKGKPLAESSKSNLLMLYNDLQNRDNWNKPKEDKIFV